MKLRIYVMIILALSISGYAVFESKKDPDQAKISQSKNIVLDYYKEIHSERKLDLDQLKIIDTKIFEQGSLVLAWYQGEGSELSLFYVGKIKDDYDIIKKVTVEPAISMGFAINEVQTEKNMILFGNFNRETWIPPDSDTRIKSNYHKMMIGLDDGSTYEKIVEGHEGYLIIFPKVNLKSFNLINSQGQVVNTLEDLLKYGNVGENIIWEI